ncbi:hypothetical protein R1sor_025760 [Riccia sorocarpa]|uniref:Uncharacterized protein n=1 Tax=Riccia sorocarpa TaxID=122646 RepID=A0ABD3G9I4_9MARC
MPRLPPGRQPRHTGQLTAANATTTTMTPRALEFAWGCIWIAWGRIAWGRICPPWDASPSCRLEISLAPSAQLGTHLQAVFWRSRLRHQPTWGRISELSSGDLACAISPPGDASPSCRLEISPAPSAHLGTHLRAVF